MTARGSHGSTILVVEDDAVNRALLHAVLASTGVAPTGGSATILDAPCLADARSCLAGRAVDLVLLDVRLPDGSGLDLARELAILADRPRVVVLSASVLPAERQAALDAGCDAFLGKPFDPPDLLGMVSHLLG